MHTPLKNLDTFNIIAIGDVVGKIGRTFLSSQLNSLRNTYSPDVIIVNGENSAGGFGITEKICNEFFKIDGIDVITTGNHWQDKKEIHEFSYKFPQLILPANMYNVSDLKRGFFTGKTKRGHKYAVINLSGCLFMKGANSSPFEAADIILNQLKLLSINIIVIDIHAEATSEKQALAHYLDGRISLIFGTHTHCPTSDARILEHNTGFQTDLGMTGAYDSVIGMKKEISISRFLEKEIKKRNTPATKDPWLCGVFSKIEITTGKCLHIESIQQRSDSL